MKIGILAVQGAFVEHEQMLERLNTDYFEIRRGKDLKQNPDGIILPGGESTVMGKLLCELDLYESLKSYIVAGCPVFGTCAGLILLAKNLLNDERLHFKTMDITVKRNAYGRQLGSFKTTNKFASDYEIPMTFIRAPCIECAGEDVQILSIVENKIVAVRQENQLATAFHPELTDDLTVHSYFLDMIRNRK